MEVYLAGKWMRYMEDIVQQAVRLSVLSEYDIGNASRVTKIIRCVALFDGIPIFSDFVRNN